MRNSVKNLLKFGSGMVTGVLLVTIIPFAVLALGLVDLSASNEPGKVESWLAPWAFARSMAHRAPVTKNPFASNTSVLPSGMAHYRENCVICHGAPNVPSSELAQGLNPPAPKLHTDDTQALKDGELFWIIKNGIRMTGMPAFGETHSDEEIWHIVTFVRHLPAITDKERAVLKSAIGGEEEHHHEGAEEESSKESPGPAGGALSGPAQGPAHQHDLQTTSPNHAH